jgi:thioredoxin-like negative regulator of GroEL
MSKKEQHKKELLEQAAKVTEKQEVQKTTSLLSELIAVSPDDTELLYARANLYEKLQKWGEAINDYLQISSIDKDDQKAKTRTEMLRTILRYNNTDIYASPNTNYDPWLE